MQRSDSGFVDEGWLTVAGGMIPDATALVRRYCGLPDATGHAEVWGYAVYDAVPSLPP